MSKVNTGRASPTQIELQGLNIERGEELPVGASAPQRPRSLTGINVESPPRPVPFHQLPANIRKKLLSEDSKKNPITPAPSHMAISVEPLPKQGCTVCGGSRRKSRKSRKLRKPRKSRKSKKSKK